MRIFAFIFLLVPMLVLAQQKKPAKPPGKTGKSDKVKETDAYTDMLYEESGSETPAHYPKGEDELYKYIAQNLKYSDADIQRRSTGSAMVSFNVYPDSTINEVKVLKTPCVDCSNQIIGLFQSIKFAPALKNNVAIKSKVILQVPIMAY